MCRYQQNDRVQEEAPSSSPRLVAVCVDRGNNSVSALKWAVEETLAANSQPQSIVLVHVKKPAQPHVKETLLPLRCFCCRKGVRSFHSHAGRCMQVFCMDVVLDDGHGDVARSIVEFVSRGVVEKLVVGATARGLFRRFMAADDIPTAISKGAPDFCNVYVIGEGGKVSSVRASTDRAPHVSPLWSEIRSLAEAAENLRSKIRNHGAAAANPPAGGGPVSMPDDILQENQELRRANETLAQRQEAHTRILMHFAELGKEPPRELLHNMETPSNMNGRQE